MIKLPPRYSKILLTLKGGGMSDTLVCEDSHLDRKVVVKALKPGIEPHRLLDELAALSAIRSRYVVQVYDVIEDGGKVVGFVEEYIEGPPLAALPTTATATDALRAVYPISAGICDIHRAGRIHRDIKPENMKYDQDGQLKVFDFGLAKLASGGSTGVLYFSEGYTAPEAFVKDASGNYTYTPAVDVFAFGATALWLLDGGSLPTKLKSIPPALPCSEADFAAAQVALPSGVVPLMNGCLAADPASRPSMEEIRRALAAELLRDRHRLLLTHASRSYNLDASNRNAVISLGGASIELNYNGVGFFVVSTTGAVAINNRVAVAGMEIVGSSVIVFGTGASRQSVTADISHPEVLL